MQHSSSIFREYDIRGKVDQELVVDQVYPLVRAIMAYAFDVLGGSLARVAIGMDGRSHSVIIANQVINAVIDSGLEVVSFGLCPSPVLYFGMANYQYDVGIMITASHNTQEYNGFKICFGKTVVWGQQLKEIEQWYKAGKTIQVKEMPGSYAMVNMIEHYITWLTEHFKILKKSPMPLLIDCGNGTAGAVLPRLIEVMGWEQVALLYPEIDGSYPHHIPDPVVAKNMADLKKMLAQGGYAWGAGLDGDCDRLGVMTGEGYLVPGDQLLALFAYQLVGVVKDPVVIYDAKSSSGLIELLDTWHVKGIMSPSGHAIIRDYVMRYHGTLAGELSCHFFFADRYFGYDDGIYALLRLMELIHQSGKTVGELISFFPKKYNSIEYRVPCSDQQKHQVVEALKGVFSSYPDVSMVTVDGIRVCFSYGWFIVRASNTQSVLSIRCESDTVDGLVAIKKIVQHALAPLLPSTDMSMLWDHV